MHVAVVGAGLSGLVAARALAAGGHRVTVLDKGRAVGGRLATRRISDATFDHGAQFFTIRSDEFGALIQPLIDEGLVLEWCRGFAPDGQGDGYPRYMVRGGMNSLAKRLAVEITALPGCEVRCSTLVFAVRPSNDGGGWSVGLDDGTAVRADALVVTSPLPQSYSILVTAEVELPEDRLMRMEYDHTIALLAVLDAPPFIRHPGGVQGVPGDFFSFVADNKAKGISAGEAVTFHVNATWSEAHWTDDTASLASELQRAAAPFVGDANIVECQVKKWRFATPRTPWPQRCWTAAPGDGSGAAAPLILAGDAFGGPKVEGAALSGLAAAAAIVAQAGS